MQLASKGILGFDIVLLANVRGIDQQSITQINELVEQGGSVVFLLGDKIDQSLFNKFFKNLAGCRVDGKIFNSPESESGLLLLANDREHFIVQKSIESDNVSTRIFQSWQLKPEQDTNTILSFDDGSPALLEKRMGKGRSLVLSFPLDAEWSNFPVQPTFLPLAHSIMHYCTPKEAAKSYYLTGDVISLDKEFNLNEKISINYPGERSETTQLSGGQFNKTEKPGIYQFNQNGKKMIAAVNVDRRESDDIFEPVEKFQSRLTTEGEIASSKRIIRAGNFSQIEIEQKQKFWRVILVILILLVLSETLLANRIPR
ncbi:MAG: hypothetical protein DWQ10_00040 [Calditrichaeota bacterium]|nr:MAG: hypothetical protein DWQ10_00040 [Calditrichota bacterium]